MKISRHDDHKMRRQRVWDAMAQQRAVDASPVTRIRAPQLERYDAHPLAARGMAQSITPVDPVRLGLDLLPTLFKQLNGKRR